MTSWVITRDGYRRHIAATETDAWHWMHRNVAYCSVDHATKFEGWKIEETDTPFDTKDDVTFRNEGTVTLVNFVSKEAQEWAVDHLADDHMTGSDGSVVVEHRYVANIVVGIQMAGMSIGGPTFNRLMDEVSGCS